MWCCLWCCNCCDNFVVIVRWIDIHIMITCWAEIYGFGVETTLLLYKNHMVRSNTINYYRLLWWCIHSFMHLIILLFVKKAGHESRWRGLWLCKSWCGAWSSVWGLELGRRLRSSIDGTRFMIRTIVEVGTTCIWVYNIVGSHHAYWLCIMVKWVKLKYMYCGAYWIMFELCCI